MTAVVPDPVAVGARTPVRTATPRHYLMCPPAHFAVEYAINPWMQPGTPSTGTAPSRSGTCCAGPTSTWGTASTCWRRCRACPTWSTRPTARPSSTAPCSPPGSATRSARPRPSPTPTWFRRAGARVVEPEFVNEGEGDLLVVGGP